MHAATFRDGSPDELVRGESNELRLCALAPNLFAFYLFLAFAKRLNPEQACSIGSSFLPAENVQMLRFAQPAPSHHTSTSSRQVSRHWLRSGRPSIAL